MSQYDILEALQALGRPATLDDIRKALKSDVPEKDHPGYLRLTLDRMVQKGKIKYDRRADCYRSVEMLEDEF